MGFFVRWCNGSTEVFGAFSRGSNPRRTATSLRSESLRHDHPPARRGLEATETVVIPHLQLNRFGSILREQLVQIVLRQTAGEAFFTQHVADGLRLALLQFPDLFLDRARSDEPVGVHRAGLTDAMQRSGNCRSARRKPS